MRWIPFVGDMTSSRHPLTALTFQFNRLYTGCLEESVPPETFILTLRFSLIIYFLVVVKGEGGGCPTLLFSTGAPVVSGGGDRQKHGNTVINFSRVPSFRGGAHSLRPKTNYYLQSIQCQSYYCWFHGWELHHLNFVVNFVYSDQYKSQLLLSELVFPLNYECLFFFTSLCIFIWRIGLRFWPQWGFSFDWLMCFTLCLFSGIGWIVCFTFGYFHLNHEFHKKGTKLPKKLSLPVCQVAVVYIASNAFNSSRFFSEHSLRNLMPKTLGNGLLLVFQGFLSF